MVMISDGGRHKELCCEKLSKNLRCLISWAQPYYSFLGRLGWLGSAKNDSLQRHPGRQCARLHLKERPAMPDALLGNPTRCQAGLSTHPFSAKDIAPRLDASLENID
jgi:hypothetical protein